MRPQPASGTGPPGRTLRSSTAHSSAHHGDAASRLREVLERQVRLVVAIFADWSVEVRPCLVLPGVQAPQVPDAVVALVRKLALRPAGAPVRLASAHRELLARVVLPEVQTPQAAVLAACGRAHTVGKGLVCQEVALLVADPQEQLLVLQARARPVRARAVPRHVVARARHVAAQRALLVQSARVAPATGPRTRADGVLAGGQQAALSVAEARVQLLVLQAHVAVMEVLRWPEWVCCACDRRADRGRQDHLPGGEEGANGFCVTNTFSLKTGLAWFSGVELALRRNPELLTSGKDSQMRGMKESARSMPEAAPHANLLTSCLGGLPSDSSDLDSKSSANSSNCSADRQYGKASPPA
eukprot:CAMPEP_0175788666 /NCGR_PEP_ID=MMETSP0097-20121207/81001_1 /TAXON_ID=311494 /ORGANISM="Alexandrium monilatum, Strain CCMP3105" /LENGTH=355 /DNA_ID=CAMNT_0017099695 /DNA_START=29 /DNA_END=1094 /DNA_ORIENTATION=+